MSLGFKRLIMTWVTTVLPAVLRICKIWSLVLREEPGLGYVERTVIRKIFGPRKNEAKGNCRKLQNADLRACTPQQI